MLRFETQYSGIRENELYILFTTTVWERLDPQQRLDALQEVENRFAGREGREPYRVAVIPPKERRPGLQGYMVFDPSVRPTIYLNENYFGLGGGLDFLGLDYSAVGALETVLHEGRHCYQYEAVLQGSDKVAPDVLQAWAVNCVNYYSSDGTQAGFGIYEFQPMERDANHFAASELKEIYRHIVNLTGERDADFEEALNRLLIDRLNSVLNVAENVDQGQLEEMCDALTDRLQDAWEDSSDPMHELMVIYGIDPEDTSRQVFGDLFNIVGAGKNMNDYLDGLETLNEELDDFSDLSADLKRFDDWLRQDFTAMKERLDEREQLDKRMDRLDMGVRRFM